MKNPAKPDTRHHLGVCAPEFLAATTIGMITYGTNPERQTDRGRTLEPVRQNTIDLARAPEEDGAILLSSQIQTLNAIFNRYAQFSMALLEGDKPQWQDALHLALRAQNECRRSIATLNELRNPKKTTFIKKNIERQQNNLVVEAKGDAQMDGGIQAEAVGVDHGLAAVGELHGGN